MLDKSDFDLKTVCAEPATRFGNFAVCSEHAAVLDYQNWSVEPGKDPFPIALVRTQ